MTETYEIKRFEALTLTGYDVQLALPTMENIQEISQAKSQHFMRLAKSGQFPALMKNSLDQIGYAYSGVEDKQLVYFAGANTTTVAAEAKKIKLPAGNYVVLKASGAPSRLLFDQLIKHFFADILPKNPTLYKEDSFVVEALLNGNPSDAVVELRIPTAD